MTSDNLEVNSAQAEQAVGEAMKAITELNGVSPGRYVVTVYSEVNPEGGFAYSWTWRFFPLGWATPNPSNGSRIRITPIVEGQVIDDSTGE